MMSKTMDTTKPAKPRAKRLSGWSIAAPLQQQGHEVYWFDGGWYHAAHCPQCNEPGQQPAHRPGQPARERR
jgi:hypothetical protein